MSAGIALLSQENKVQELVCKALDTVWTSAEHKVAGRVGEGWQGREGCVPL